MSDYRPVSCQVHSEYELAIMRRTRLPLRWQDERGREFQALVLPLDLRTRGGAEYLVVRLPGGELREVRLDRILGPRDQA